MVQRKSQTLIEILNEVGELIPEQKITVFSDWSVTICATPTMNDKIVIDCKDVYVGRARIKEALRHWKFLRKELEKALYSQGYSEFYAISMGQDSITWCKRLGLTPIWDRPPFIIYKTEVDQNDGS